MQNLGLISRLRVGHFDRDIDTSVITERRETDTGVVSMTQFACSSEPHPELAGTSTAWRKLFTYAFGALLLVACSKPELTPTVTPTQPPMPAFTPTATRAPNSGGSTRTPTTTLESPACIPSGDHTSIQIALISPGSKAVLCPNAVFELNDTVLFTYDNQEIYTQGFPRDDSRALLRVVGKKMATAVSAESNDYVALRNVIIDGNRPQLGFAEGALINFGRGVEGRDAEGHVVEWVKAYEPRGWAIIYLGGPCRGAVARNNEIGPGGRAEFLVADGISMEDYWPLEGDFTGTRVTGNVIDAAGAMIRKGIGMGPHTGCVPDGEAIRRSRGAVVTGNTLMGDHMAYGFVIGGVEDWTVTGNVDLSTHLTSEVVADCFGNVVDPPAGFQLNPATSSGTFQAEFEAAVLGSTGDMWPFQPVISESCIRDLIGAEALAEIKAGNRRELGSALEATPNGERLGQCFSVYTPPDFSDFPDEVGLAVLPCAPLCAELRLSNLSETDTADLRRAEFLLDDILVPCHGLPESLGPGEEVHCTIEDFVIPGLHVLNWYGFPAGGGNWFFTYPFEEEEALSLS